MVDFRGLHFPKLKKLQLENYTFSHDWQLDWILSHGATLEELMLDDCPIVSFIRNYGEIDEEGYPVRPEQDQSWPPKDFTTWRYERSWGYYFGQMEERLVNLREYREVDGSSYVAFDRGVGPTPWIEEANPYSGSADKEYGLPVEEFKEEDDKAYESFDWAVQKRCRGSV